MVLVSFDGLSMVSHGKTLIKHATAQIMAGDKILLTGQSGAGKSLLLQLLGGQIGQHTGTLYHQGQTPEQLTPSVWRHRLAYLTQNPQMVDGTVLDNLQLPFRFSYHNRRQFDQKFHTDILSKLNKSADFLTAPIAQLSGGERQLVHLLRTLQLNPCVLLLDEPTAALDVNTAAHITALLNAWVDASTIECPRAYVWIDHHQTHDAYNKKWQMLNQVLHTEVLR